MGGWIVLILITMMCYGALMKEIDQKLDQWIYNSIIRAEIRELIVKEINKYKLNTNTKG